MIKIMHFCSDSNIGGAGIVLYRLLAHADKHDFSHTVVLPKNSALIPLFDTVGIKCVFYTSEPDRSLSFSAISEFVRIILEHSPHIVHTHGLASARAAAFLCGVKCRIYTRHTYNKNEKASLARRALNGIITTRAVAVNQSLVHQMVRSGIKVSKIVLIENGCECMRDAPRENTGALSLLCHGRIEESKGLVLSVEAVSILIKKGYKVRLVILGDGSFKKELVALCESMELDGTVEFCTATENVRSYINQADVILNCSYEAEGTSNSVIEGMSAGKPVVVSSAEGNINVVTDGTDGLIFERGSAVSLAECLQRIISDTRLYRKLSDGAYSTYKARFDADMMAAGYQKLWRDDYEAAYKK